MTDSSRQSRDYARTYMSGDTRQGHRSKRGRSRKRKRIIKRVVLVVVLVAILAAIWLAFSAFMAVRASQTAEKGMAALQSSMSNPTELGKLADPAITQSMSQVSEGTSQAAFWTSGPVWWAAGKVPFLGNSVRAVSATTSASQVAAQGALDPLVKAAAEFSSGKLRSTNGAFNLDLLAKMQTPLAVADRSMINSVQEANSAPVDGVLGVVASRTEPVNARLHQLQGQVAGLRTAVDVMPLMLGADGPQSYFLGVTSPAEARGTGGFLGTYGIIKANKGKLNLVKTGTNSDLTNFNKPLVDLGVDYRATYGDNAAYWSGMNLSPHFPYAAQQWIAGWKKQTGEQLDGAIAIDVTTLGYLTKATGPIKLPNGKQLSGQAIVDYLTNQIYVDYANDNATRKELQVDTVRSLYNKLASGSQSPLVLASPMARAASEGRVLVYSADSQIEQKLEPWPISGTIDTRPGPYAFLVVNNMGGNKMEYYLQRTLQYNLQQCQSGVATSEITTTLLNSIPRGVALPNYVDDRQDAQKGKNARGSTLLSQMVLLPMGAQVKSVELDGKPVSYTPTRENGRPGIAVATNLKPRMAAKLQIVLEEPGSENQPRVPVQPLVKDQKTIVSWPGCS